MSNFKVNGNLTVMGGGSINGHQIVSYCSSSACAKNREWGMGWIDYQLSNGQRLRHYFGNAWVNDGVVFGPNPYSQILWATSTNYSEEDSQNQRGTINTMSNTGLTFKGGAGILCKWEAWGLI